MNAIYYRTVCSINIRHSTLIWTLPGTLSRIDLMIAPTLVACKWLISDLVVKSMRRVYIG